MSRDFDGVDDKIVFSTVFGMDGLTSNVSVALWVFLDSTNEKGIFFKIGNEVCANGNNGWAIGVGSGDADTLGNEVIGLFECVRWIDVNANIGTGWHFLSMTIDGGGTPQMWIDGVSKGTSAGTALRGPAPGDKTSIGSSTDGTRPVDANIAYVHLYAIELSKNQILQIMYNPGSIRNGLKAFIPLWGSSPEADYSEDAEYGTVTGALVSNNNPPINGLYYPEKPVLEYASI